MLQTASSELFNLTISQKLSKLPIVSVKPFYFLYKLSQ